MIGLELTPARSTSPDEDAVVPLTVTPVPLPDRGVSPVCIWLGLVAIELVGARVCRSGPKAATMSRTDSIPNQFELHAFGGGLPVGPRATGEGVGAWA